ncbi:MAG: DUF4142 domain-containing protein [Alphaproteobacteria bacterium]|nr:DUF4142 domain-containing protein [Alphaproteobacteria bacterium]
MKTLSATALAFVLSTASHIAVAGSREDFLNDAIKGANSEIMLGQLAARHGGTPSVREYGRTLMNDHGKAKMEASRLARRLNVDPPTRATLKADAEYVKLRTLSGKSFDREFLGYMIEDHRKDIREFTGVARAHHGAVGDFASAQLPTLRKHLRMAEKMMMS